MGINPIQQYESQMYYLIQEYKSLSFEDRKRRFTEFVRREADIFARVIETAHISNITTQDYNTMMYKRNDYQKKLFDLKDVCSIF